MIDPREEYGQTDPWGDFEDGESFLADHIYEGRREEILDLILLTEVYAAFEHWADDFRYWDRLESKIPMSRWEEESPFSERTSIQISMAPHQEEL